MRVTAQFRRILSDFGIDAVLTPPRAPNCDAIAERFVRSIKGECLGRMDMFGEASLQRAVREYVEHYHLERPHQGLGNCVIERVVGSPPTSTTAIHVHERLGGLLRHCKRAA